jgi:peptide-methionine (S)-S-oxide reductase
MLKLLIISLIAFINFNCGDTKKMINTDYKEAQFTGDSSKLEHATLGAGCFWCVEAVFQRLKGVVSVESGYSGGRTKNPTYQEVSAGTTGHVEVARITFDPGITNFETILNVFWHTHDPTTLNRQGADVGEQYRSVIFNHNDEQKKTAEEIKEKTEKSGLWNKPIVTAIEPLSNYYKAEDYHQNYFNNNTNAPYCSAVVGPKVAKFMKEFPELLKEEVK